jgi:anti-anti-sigma factor
MDVGTAVLIEAMEAAPAGIWYLSGDAAPIWANARARAFGSRPDELPVVGGHRVSDLVATALRTGRPASVHGAIGEEGPFVSAVVRPLQTAAGSGVLLVVEPEEAGGEGPWPTGEADVVEKAQNSLLPPSLPLLPDLWLSGSYHRASSVRAAGGDWYDAVPLGDGRLALVVGDAVGHGVPAVGAMSRLRGAMRSSALLDPSPVAVIQALDAFAGQMEDVEGASVFYGVLDASTGKLSYAAAGHPAPLVVGTDGAPRFLPVVPRPPLGSVPDPVTQVTELELEQGATLILFSDGAVVGGGRPPDDGLARLAEVAADVLSGSEEEIEASTELAAAVAEGVRTPGGWADDVAVLVAHRRGMTLEPVVLDLSAVPSSLPGVRRRLGSWLIALGMGEQDRVGVMVAVGEACANAVEHAYRGQEPGRMYVRAHVDVDGVLTVRVRDEGTWRPPDRDPGDRGRGLLIMRQMVDRVVLVEDHGTSVTLSVRLRRTPEVDVERAVAEAAATVVVDRTGSRPMVRVTGSVDSVSAELMRIRLLEASHGGTTSVELDLTGVSTFTSAGVRVVLAIARIARDEGWRLVVHAPEGGVTRHILQISGLAGLVDLP